MSTKKTKNNLLKIFSNIGVTSAALTASKVHAGGGAGGGGAAGGIDTNVQHYSAVEGTDEAEGLSVGSYEADTDQDGDVDATMDVRSAPSTPFLAVWDGKKYIHENDFLFGKPNTVFANYQLGLKAYKEGIGGDTYLIREVLQPDQVGTLKMQIRELEPEESYIDTFEVNALDLKDSEHFIVDGNLEDSYVFNTEDVKNIVGEMHQFHAKNNLFTKVEGAYTSLAPVSGKSITMQTGDELIIRLPKAQLDLDRDTFILVDSHFRDWSLGDQVPFTRMEKFIIQSVALGQKSAVAIAGITILASMAVFSEGKTTDNVLAKLLSVPHSYADYVIGVGMRSLVVAAGDSTGMTYLQTLFPRYVQASQEVVRIPQEIIAKLKDEFLSVRIKATKKHKVLTAFVFQGEAEIPKLEKLAVSVVDSTNGFDYTEQLKEKNSLFLHTTPGDVLDVTVKDSPRKEGMSRRYVLKTNGFYTRMSRETSAKVGKNWLDRLLPEDRALLKDLRLS